MTIHDKLEQEFSFVTSVSDVPNMAWNIMSFRPCHFFTRIVLDRENGAVEPDGDKTGDRIQ